MRFLVDECTGPAVARWLSSQGHEDERAQAKIAVLERLIAGFAEQLAGEFVVASETRVRFARGFSEQS